MSVLGEDAQAKWMTFIREEKMYLKRYGLNHVILLTDTQVNSSFISQIQGRWDKRTHTFRFGHRELCPTVEEFRAIMGIKYETILRPKISDSTRPMLKRDFKYTRAQAESITKNGFLDLRMLCDLVTGSGDIPNTAHARLTAITVLLTHYLLRPKDGKPSVRVFEIACQMKEKELDPSHIILAETLMGLDEVFGSGRTLQQGSPVILYIWLIEKLGLLKPHPVTKELTIIAQLSRLSDLAEEKLEATFEDDAFIRSTMPWYGIKRMVYEMKGKPIITLLGLNETTFYVPGRIPRQFGGSRLPAFRFGKIAQTPKFNVALYLRYPLLWEEAQRKDVMITREDEPDDIDDEGFRKLLRRNRRRQKRNIRKGEEEQQVKRARKDL